MQKTNKPSPPLKWHGGKHYLAPKIVALMPPHRHYVEPFAGGLSVLLAKDPVGVSEVVNDLDGRLTNFWRILQRKESFEKFQRIVEAIPFSETEWREGRCWTAELGPDHAIHEAVAFFVECRMSLAGRMQDFAPLSRRRTRRGMNEQVSAWWNAVTGLRSAYRRLPGWRSSTGPPSNSSGDKTGRRHSSTSTRHTCPQREPRRTCTSTR